MVLRDDDVADENNPPRAGLRKITVPGLRELAAVICAALHLLSLLICLILITY